MRLLWREGGRVKWVFFLALFSEKKGFAIELRLGRKMETYHEHSGLVPYCDVRGICALRSQMAGMSPLKAVEFVSGIENSRRKIFWAPEKPSTRL